MSRSAEIYVRDVPEINVSPAVSDAEFHNLKGQSHSRRVERDDFVSEYEETLRESRLGVGARPYPYPKQVKILLSPKELEIHGLCYFDDSEAQEWIIPLDADNLVNAKESAGWYANLTARIDELRTISEEEELCFSDLSAKQALEFAHQVAASIQPSAFLVGNGNVRFLWSSGNEQIGLQFRGEESVIQYVMFVRRGEKLASHMGIDEPAVILRQISALGLRRLLNS